MINHVTRHKDGTYSVKGVAFVKGYTLDRAEGDSLVVALIGEKIFEKMPDDYEGNLWDAYLQFGQE